MSPDRHMIGSILFGVIMGLFADDLNHARRRIDLDVISRPNDFKDILFRSIHGRYSGNDKESLFFKGLSLIFI